MHGIMKNIYSIIAFFCLSNDVCKGSRIAFETFVLFYRIALYDNSFAAFLQFHFIPVGLQANSFE